ncbi:Ms5788A family Cys-rich leader peptide [Actinoplanes sp. G11-F43]|uniref:Ms5788A family Cys-rich leader peptide n=1 Tax=Actinoplanes sp. G11-F43 TaxID=3424130 RepID=UPI003D32C3DA
MSLSPRRVSDLTRSRIVVGSVPLREHAGRVGHMSPLLTKRRAVDLCRVAACLCRPVI